MSNDSLNLKDRTPAQLKSVGALLDCLYNDDLSLTLTPGEKVAVIYNIDKASITVEEVHKLNDFVCEEYGDNPPGLALFKALNPGGYLEFAGLVLLSEMIQQTPELN